MGCCMGGGWPGLMGSMTPGWGCMGRFEGGRFIGGGPIPGRITFPGMEPWGGGSSLGLGPPCMGGIPGLTSGGPGSWGVGARADGSIPPGGYC